jgi:CRP-like cAMP-binding protein
MNTDIPAPRLELLRGLPVFEGLSDQELAQIYGLVDDIELEPGHLLTREGFIGHHAFIIVHGELAMTISGRQVAILGRGELVGETALIDDHPRTATVTALTPVHVLVLDRATFNSVMAEADLARKVRSAIEQRHPADE